MDVTQTLEKEGKLVEVSDLSTRENLVFNCFARVNLQNLNFFPHLNNKLTFAAF